MTKDIFKASLEATFGEFSTLVAAENGDWTVKGFIDLYKNIGSSAFLAQKNKKGLCFGNL